jgi:hypothetical protein
MCLGERTPPLYARMEAARSSPRRLTLYTRVGCHLCDGPQSLRPEEFAELMTTLRAMGKVLGAQL